MKITLGEIQAHRPCGPGWDTLIAACGTDDPAHTVSLIDILESNGLDHALWATRCLPRRERVSLALAFAEPVEYLSPTARTCNAVTRRWLAGDVTDDELKAAAAAAVAAWDAAAASAAAAARESAAWAEWAAARAAWSAKRAAAGIPYDPETIMRRWCAEQEATP